MALLVERVVAPHFATNCWVVSRGQGQECLLVDPGIGDATFMAEVSKVVNENRLRVGAILVTHGHLDHTFSIASVIEDFMVRDLLIHEEDRDLLEFPERGMGPHGLALMAQLAPVLPYRSSHQFQGLMTVTQDQSITLGDLSIDIKHTPGHTPGSICAVIEDELLISGDTLFAGSIGRTDLPRGSISEISTSLREKLAPLPEYLRILPGHGPESRMEQELKSNPYLRAAIAGDLA